MTKLYGAALAEQIRAERQRILDAMKRREIRIENGETDEDDCFLSMRSEEQNLRKCDMQLSILDTDGLMEFDGVFDADGKEVNVHPITNRWGKISYTGRGGGNAGIYQKIRSQTMNDYELFKAKRADRLRIALSQTRRI